MGVSRLAILAIAAAMFGGSAMADDLYRDRRFAGLAGDQKASEVGDALSVIVYQSAEARNSSRSASRRRSIFEGGFAANNANEWACLPGWRFRRAWRSAPQRKFCDPDIRFR